MRFWASADSWSQFPRIRSICAIVPVLKAAEARLLLVLAAANGAKIVKTDTKQAYMYCDMGDDVVYIRPPD